MGKLKCDSKSPQIINMRDFTPEEMKAFKKNFSKILRGEMEAPIPSKYKKKNK